MSKIKLLNNDSTARRDYSKKNESYSNESLWKKGKKEYKKFTNYNFKRSTFWRTTLGGMLLTLVVMLPVLLIMIAFFNAFYYMLFFRIFLYLLAWALLLICNGLSNYFTVQMSKTYVTDDENLQNIDSIAIFFYSCLNIGFMVCSLLIIIFILFVTI